MRSICRASLFVTSLLLPLFCAATAGAQGNPTSFGRAGQLAVSWDQPLYESSNPPASGSPVELEYSTSNNNGPQTTSFGLAPAADYFIVDNVSLGGQVLFGIVTNSQPQGNGTSTSTTATLYGIAPQVGYDLSITDMISFWPKLYIAFSGESLSNNGGAQTSGTIGIFAPFLFHLAPHFYVGGGPDISQQMFVNRWQGNASANNVPLATDLGIMATFGGYFSLVGE